MVHAINTLRIVCITFVSLIMPNNLHLCVIVRVVDGKRIEGRYDIVMLLHVGVLLFVAPYNCGNKFHWIVHVQSLN